MFNPLGSSALNGRSFSRLAALYLCLTLWKCSYLFPTNSDRHPPQCPTALSLNYKPIKIHEVPFKMPILIV